MEIGDFYLRRKKFKAALSRYQEAVKTDPHYAPAYRGLGKVYERIGLRQKALDAYRRYLDELPSAQEAREAKPVHKAIARLQKQLSSGRNPRAANRLSSSGSVARARSLGVQVIPKNSGGPLRVLFPHQELDIEHRQ